MSGLAKPLQNDYVPRVRLRVTKLQTTILFAGLVSLPGIAAAQNLAANQTTACSEGPSVLWSQVPEQNWAATHSLLEEIALTPEVPLSVDPEAARLLNNLEIDVVDIRPLDTADDTVAAPEKPGICFTELDPSCVRDPGSSSPATVQHLERCSSLEERIFIKQQPATDSREYLRRAVAVGPEGVRTDLERPPAL